MRCKWYLFVVCELGNFKAPGYSGAGGWILTCIGILKAAIFI